MGPCCDRRVLHGRLCGSGLRCAAPWAHRRPVAMDTTAWYRPSAPEAWARRAAHARTGGMAALLPFQHERWLSPTFRAAHPEIEAAADGVFLRNDVACYEATCLMLGTTDLRNEVSGIVVPTTVVVGSDDTATPSAMAEEIVRRIKGARLQVLGGARHLTPLEWPEEIANLLRRAAA